MHKFKFFLVLPLITSALIAEPSGYIELGGMALSQKSNTEPMLFHANKSLDSLHDSPLVQKEIDPYVNFEYANTFHNAKLTTTLNEEDRLSLRVEGDTLGALVFVKPSYEFKNPYALYANRATTLLLETGAGAIYKIPLDNNTSLEFAYTLSQKNVLDDELGRQIASLQRDGYVHRIDSTWTNNFFKLTAGGFISQNMGSAENHKGADIKVSSVYSFDKMQITGTASFAHKKYSDINPFFDAIRNQNNLKASLSLEYDFSHEGYYTIVGIMANRQYSNIQFFDESVNALFAGIGKNF